jgi:enoyl-CoA hydratase/carnithine racemase
MSTNTSAAGAPPSLHLTGAVACITLQRPANHNRLQPQDMMLMRDYLRQLSGGAGASGVRALLISASGPSFCSGFDLSSADAVAGDDNEPAAILLRHLCDELEAFPWPTVCALDGGVYGGGTDLALACDFRLGSPACKLRMPAVALGVRYYPSGLRRYVSRLGLTAAKRLFLGGETFDAQTLLSFHFLDALAEDGAALDTAARALADKLAALPPQAVQYTKRTLNRIAQGECDIEAGNLAYRQSLSSDEFKQALDRWNQRKS